MIDIQLLRKDPEAVAKIVLAEIEKAEAVDQPSALYLP